MKILVVYDSLYGNTEKIARAICTALGSGTDVGLIRAANVEVGWWAGLKLLIVGSPTQRFRSTAVIARLIKDIPKNGLKGVKVAAFDTRLTGQIIERIRPLAFFVRIFGYAAKPIADGLRRKGGQLITPAQGFYVEGMEGPLQKGDLARAADWAKKIQALLKD